MYILLGYAHWIDSSFLLLNMSSSNSLTLLLCNRTCTQCSSSYFQSSLCCIGCSQKPPYPWMFGFVVQSGSGKTVKLDSVPMFLLVFAFIYCTFETENFQFHLMPVLTVLTAGMRHYSALTNLVLVVTILLTFLFDSVYVSLLYNAT